MNRYLKISIAIAVFSILVSGGILFTIITDVAFLAKEENLTNKISAITQISTAISAIFGLIIGSIAIIAVIEADKSEVKAIESFKLDLISLVNLLMGLRSRCLFYTNTKIINYEIDIFQKEREYLQSFLSSSSGYALNLWILEKRKIKDLYTNVQLSSLIDLMTLQIREHPQNIFTGIAVRTQKIVEKLTIIDDSDLKDIYINITKIGNGLSEVRNIIEKDEFYKFVNGIIDAEESAIDSLKMPSDEFVSRVIAKAKSKIGGKADKTVMYFLEEARKGDKKSLHTFYRIIEELRLDE